MILINSYLHRQTFYSVIKRWMYHRAHLHDAELITRLVHFNNAYISRYLQRFTEMVFKNLFGQNLKTRFAIVKRDLKDIIVTNPPSHNSRIKELIDSYHMYPERYYRETPFHGTLYFQPTSNGDLYLGSDRIKRVRRLAEKCARRIIDHTFEAIKARADELATDRARQLGVTREALVSHPGEMLTEFLKAEDRLLDDLRNHKPVSFAEDLAINDVAGIKIIMEDDDYCRVLELFNQAPDCEVIEEEPHQGHYNAINLIIRHTPPKSEILARPLGKPMLELIKRRGLDPEQANREFANFVHTGEDQVNIEVIVCNYQEMLESEIGRCIHEDRIINQRLQQEYRGHLAKNIEYLMVYLFNFAVSPQIEIGELPIKLWNRYLPDYFDEVMRSLFEIPPLRLVD
ncbi:MAG: hypothetical protein JRJ87_11925 [Deltaproteobacteria bacterium]|nr:hypothetical protein [Deltaproteobacteria bacterium]